MIRKALSLLWMRRSSLRIIHRLRNTARIFTIYLHIIRDGKRLSFWKNTTIYSIILLCIDNIFLSKKHENRTHEKTRITYSPYLGNRSRPAFGIPRPLYACLYPITFKEVKTHLLKINIAPPPKNKKLVRTEGIERIVNGAT